MTYSIDQRLDTIVIEESMSKADLDKIAILNNLSSNYKVEPAVFETGEEKMGYSILMPAEYWVYDASL